MDLQQLFKSYVQAGLYLRGWSPKTVPIYQRAFTSFQQSQRQSSHDGSDDVLTKARLEAWVISLRKRDLSPACINIYIRALNAFCSWLKEEGHVREQLKLKQIKHHSKPVTTFSDVEIRLFLAGKPKRLVHLRTWVLAALMLDTGCRIDEVLNLTRSGVDFDNLLLTVDGKGGKQRRVPFSPELRKHLWTFCQKHSSIRLFATQNGTRLAYRNAYRDIKACFRKTGVDGPHVHPHNLRHSFACNYVKTGGSIVALSRILGHSSITTTQTYLRGLQVEDFQQHSRFSLLSRR